MKYIRSFASMMTSEAESDWIVRPDEGLGCSIRLRGEKPAPDELSASDFERFAWVLKGEGVLETSDQSIPAETGSLMFLPRGVAGSFVAKPGAMLLDIEATDMDAPTGAGAQVISVDQSKFEGDGFAYQALLDRQTGASSMRTNILQVQPGAGSPDFHIHMFTQLYVILEGKMTIDIGKSRHVAEEYSVVCLPPGVAHRNFNGSPELERHISLLVPEPKPDEIFDYAVDIHEREAELMQKTPV